MSRYAENTSVPVERSKAEIERILQRYGADEMVSAWKASAAVIQFKMQNRHIRFVLPLPQVTDYTHSESGRALTPTQTQAAWEQGCRQRWRALTLSIKAKLESAESSIEAFDVAFMGQIVMPNGKTVAEQVLPVIEDAYQSKKMPATPMLTW